MFGMFAERVTLCWQYVVWERSMENRLLKPASVLRLPPANK
jgi:hypothetical protein